MDPRQILTIAQREYVARVRTKAFVIGTLALPAMIVAIGFVIGLMGRTDIDELRLAVVDEGTGLGTSFSTKLAEFERPEILVSDTLDVEDFEASGRRDELTRRILAGELDGYFLLRPDEEIRARLAYYARETSNPALLESFEGVFETTVLEAWLQGSGLDPARIRRLQSAGVDAITVSERGEEAGGFGVAYVGGFLLAMLLFLPAMVHGQQMALAIVEEKSSRLIELILGAVTPTEFMAGKILGNLGVGLTQLAIWVAMAAVGLLLALPALAAGAATAGIDWTTFVDPRAMFYFVFFFLLGYVFYATLMAAVASTCTTAQEFSTAMQVPSFVLIIGFYFIFYAVANPTSTLSRIVSFIPPWTPLVMFARVNVAPIPTWEVVASIVVLALGTLALVWVAAKVFRVTLLLHGKRPSAAELWRLVRAA